ncbi:GNAT family N-acetyltransferase [Brevibacterium aurantiacum]|uniref:GNAT family N-acetyltransferase n=1 Tax=Brevibacterium aurantiacum TaxID=273384 RepID=A0A3Q8STA4_BREAU|nr:N-acetyltransferase [Brevibacterium aurantiacum]TGD40173.1 GNAT family N-acetyltransferase [Brevibacterium aurantiacum]
MAQTRWSAVRDDQVPDDVDRLLLTVPEWFGRPESNAEYVDDARTMETWTVRNEAGEVVGVTLVSWHFDHSAEVHFTVVDRSEHGTGAGTAMMRAIAADVRRRGATLLQVKTLGASNPDPNYDRTRHFYQKVGFFPLEEIDLWDEQTPCLIMVMPLV